MNCQNCGKPIPDDEKPVKLFSNGVETRIVICQFCALLIMSGDAEEIELEGWRVLHERTHGEET